MKDAENIIKGLEPKWDDSVKKPRNYIMQYAEHRSLSRPEALYRNLSSRLTKILANKDNSSRKFVSSAGNNDDDDDIGMFSFCCSAIRMCLTSRSFIVGILVLSFPLSAVGNCLIGYASAKNSLQKWSPTKNSDATLGGAITAGVLLTGIRIFLEKDSFLHFSVFNRYKQNGIDVYNMESFTFIDDWVKSLRKTFTACLGFALGLGLAQAVPRYKLGVEEITASHFNHNLYTFFLTCFGFMTVVNGGVILHQLSVVQKVNMAD